MGRRLQAPLHVGFFHMHRGDDRMPMVDRLEVEGYTYDRILVDMNTQRDLLLPGGAMPVVNRTEVLPNIQKIMNWARDKSLPVVSSLESRRKANISRGLPPYCIEGSEGQQKIPFTMLPSRVLIHDNNVVDDLTEPFRMHQQIILTKRSRDFLSNPAVDRLFQSVSVNHVVIFGTVAERCVKAVGLGFLARRQRIGIVTDACGAWCIVDANLAMSKLETKGAVLVSTNELISGIADERLREKSKVWHPIEFALPDAAPNPISEPFCWP